MSSANNLNALAANLMVDELVRLGVDQFCIAPGSRSTALTVAVASHAKAHASLCYDERSLGYFALGLAKAKRAPVALICTSGTAVANLMPAVVEASNDRVPLLLLTADRPPELRETGANQTSDQVKIFGDFVRGFIDLPPPDDRVSARSLLGTIDYAVARARGPLPGPVHVNCMFREPLEPTHVEAYRPEFLNGLERWLTNDLPLVSYADSLCPAPNAEAVELVFRAERGVVVLGSLPNRSDQEAALALARHLGWPVFADITSGVRLTDDERVIHHVDHLLLHPRFAELVPDVVLQLGGRVTSKRLMQFLERRRGAWHVFVDDHGQRSDPGFVVTHHSSEGAAGFAALVLSRASKSQAGEFTKAWQAGSKCLAALFDEVLGDDAELSEPGVARVISRRCGFEHVLYLSSSMPIRDMDMFGAATAKAPQVVSNRGASGIDGVTSSACGFALGSGLPTTLLIGDLAFLHDANGLSLVAKSKTQVIVVVVNNQGGGIFSFLPIAKSREVFTPYFETPHDHQLCGLSQTFSLAHTRVTSTRDFVETYEQALRSGRSQVIEVASATQTNIAFHERLKSAALEALGSL